MSTTVYARQKQVAFKPIEYLQIGEETLPIFSSYYILDNEIYWDLDETQFRIVYVARDHENNWKELNNVVVRQLKAQSRGLIKDIERRIDPDDIEIIPEYLPGETVYKIAWKNTVLAAAVFSFFASLLGSGIIILITSVSSR